MADFHNNIMYEAAQQGVKVRRENGVYFVEGFEIKALKDKLRISGYVYVNYNRGLHVLFETTSAEYANHALRRTFMVSKEISRIKDFEAFRNDSRIRVQIELNQHTTHTYSNFIVQNSKYGNAKFYQTPCVDISVRYYVPCINDKYERHLFIAKETYLEKRFADSRHWPSAQDFTKFRKWESRDFENGVNEVELNNLHKVGLPYNVNLVRVDRVEQYDEAAQEVFKEYGLALPPDKVITEYIAVKAPKPEFTPGMVSPHVLAS